MKKQITEQQLKLLSQQYLDESIENLDVSVTSRLQTSRNLALQSNSRDFHTSHWVSAFATVMLFIAVIWQINQQPSVTNEDFLLVEDMMQVEENQDLLNDLEFYKWLEEQGELA